MRKRRWVAGGGLSSPAEKDNVVPTIGRRLAPAGLAVGVLVSLTATALPAVAAAGGLDPSFGQNGVVTVASDSNGGATPSAQLVQPDGKILVVDGSEIMRFNPDGSLDSGFGNGGRVETSLDTNTNVGAGAALQPDGKIVVAGRIGVGTNSTDVLVMRFNPDGSPDFSFGSSGQVVTNPTSGTASTRLSSLGDAVIVQGDGKILVGGLSVHCFGRPCAVQAALVRYNSNGSLDSGFGNGGVALSGSDTNSFATVGENSAGEIFALDASGGISEFSPSGAARPTANATSISIASQTANPIFLPDGRYVVAGVINDAAGGPFDGDVSVVRHLGTGAIDTSFTNPAFNYGAEPTNRQLDQGLGVALQADGKVVVVGSGSGGVGIARVNTNGTLDSGFGNGGTIVDTARPGSVASVVTIQPDGKILVGEGQFVSSTAENLILARYLAS